MRQSSATSRRSDGTSSEVEAEEKKESFRPPPLALPLFGVQDKEAEDGLEESEGIASAALKACAEASRRPSARSARPLKAAAISLRGAAACQLAHASVNLRAAWGLCDGAIEPSLA